MLGARGLGSSKTNSISESPDSALLPSASWGEGGKVGFGEEDFISIGELSCLEVGGEGEMGDV